ncbi:MAG: ATP-binding protein [Ilumatobacter sp.]|nr:ATP-binding protein [Ilumatobacter sp.]
MRTDSHPPRHRSHSVRDRAGIAAARRFVRRVATPHLDQDRVVDVELVTSELVTNALEHTPADERRDVEVSVDLSDHALDVSVAAPAAELPRLSDGDVPVTARRGRGLYIVSALCDNVGVSASGSLVRVSCRFNLT